MQGIMSKRLEQLRQNEYFSSSNRQNTIQLSTKARWMSTVQWYHYHLKVTFWQSLSHQRKLRLHKPEKMNSRNCIQKSISSSEPLKGKEFFNSKHHSQLMIYLECKCLA